jgi:hypothetical protein
MRAALFCVVLIVGAAFGGYRFVHDDGTDACGRHRISVDILGPLPVGLHATSNRDLTIRQCERQGEVTPEPRRDIILSFDGPAASRAQDMLADALLTRGWRRCEGSGVADAVRVVCDPERHVIASIWHGTDLPDGGYILVRGNELWVTVHWDRG